MAAIPDEAKPLLEGKHFAHVATINSDGTPQVSAV
ncbi:MAG: pyridoxamine 5'-phosphate oxidase family protein, partial [Actinobacteria bacterium]|nr:pyridoxamine 5'-phosphate oxidase family protein [Actinomycetota bacterium]